AIPSSNKCSVVFKWSIELLQLIVNPILDEGLVILKSPRFSSGSRFNDSWFLNLSVPVVDAEFKEFVYAGLNMADSEIPETTAEYYVYILNKDNEKCGVKKKCCDNFQRRSGYSYFKVMHINELLEKQDDYFSNDMLTLCVEVISVHDDNAWNANHISLDDEHVHGDKIFPELRNSYSMSSYVDPDTNDTCLIVSGGENLKTYNADSEIWKFNLTSLKYGIFLVNLETWNTNVTSVAGLASLQEHVFSRKVYSAWTRIPTLVDICWDAVLYYHPNLPNESKDIVQIKFGIPWNFLQEKIK
ncbi:Protein of unknown function, partial [Cotesia congregata]